MAFVIGERLKTFAMQKGVQLLQNPTVTTALVKAFEYGNGAKAIIDGTANKVAKSFNLVVKNEFAETNHSIRALKDDVKNLTETVRDLQKQMERSAPRKK